MRCDRIYFEGYKRLAKTDCNVSPKLLAFVGQNEAGKSSVLRGLEWLTEDGETPLADLDKNRSNKKDSGWIVGAVFSLDPEERALLDPLGFKKAPKKFSLWKQADGSLNVVFRDPSKPEREPGPFSAAAALLATARSHLEDEFSKSDEVHGEGTGPRQWAELIGEQLASPDEDWSDVNLEALKALATWLDEAADPEGEGEPRDPKAAASLGRVADLAAEHPAEAGIEILRDLIPRFVLFGEQDRELPTITPLDPNQRDIRPAVSNILTIARLDPSALWDAYASNDTGEVATLLSDANERLDAFFGEAWNQSNVALRLSMDRGGLQTHIYEIETKRYTRIEERSDGLRAFIALAGFLRAQDLAVPPVVLIDEAEQHLHVNAQADLVGVLLKQVQATQVFYTTHSPSCLPSDLGTGVRLLERGESTSQLRPDFWDSDEPGFGPLLMAMGAGAAAFSACRWAVLAEGPSDMVLLPTLLRAATELDDLPYQVAPGLAQLRFDSMRVEEVAAKVVYLADGDSDGDRYRESLLNAGVPDRRIFQLPSSMAAEDLLDIEFFLRVVTNMLPEESPAPLADDLSDDVTVMLSLERWAKQQASPVAIPGKVAVAYRVVESAKVALKPEAQEVLVQLHAGIVNALAE